MSNMDPSDVRSTAQLILSNARQGNSAYNMQYDMSRAHSINLITEDFLAGYMQDGRMSVVRRFFCLFVTFDLVFVSLLWLICIVINGDNIFTAFHKQIVEYTIYKSLFDVVAVAICRFVVLIFFYAVLYINHWSIIALSTSGSCLFLISKVFVFDWLDSKQQVFEVILIITSFILAWGEAWFLDCRVIPQERHAQHYFRTMTSNDRTPMDQPAILIEQERPPQSVTDFYSLMDTARHSDEEDELDDEYTQMGLDCLRKAYEIIESSDWKVEKVTQKGDTIHSTQRDKIGKIYKLTARIKYPAKALMEDLFYRIEDCPKWNPALLESKIVRKINSYTDITYQVSVGGGGGMVKSRDFVNLRSCRLFYNGQICDDDETAQLSSDDGNISLNRSCEGSVSTISDGDSNTPLLPSSVSSCKATFPSSSKGATMPFDTLGNSLGAKSLGPIVNFDEEPPPLDQDEFEDAKDKVDGEANNMTKPNAPSVGKTKDKVWVTSAISVQYAAVPPSPKYTRGQNIVSGFAFREIVGKSDSCIVEWVLCLDLKGYIPRYVLDAALTSSMTDYISNLRKHVNELRQRGRGRAPRTH
ncbi:steroidogenic acute regulatory protein-like [Drosophila sechellia]|uniref:GM11878 n=1 Tax=Drosophila sechellia TaxID=7238 RepID=B4IH40_DROSE|nr:steroidogenic acute regulatory protein-like [Drosophila sechellia]XP_032571987.1 steroidogenic acute regulatory protein-like [Drosophila sechellia]XP_032571988.1 steroidogenic acute regulatory protein-like [Drosophila sechellia]EDW49216.1 GM11878 [Drosophila sechellia]